VTGFAFWWEQTELVEAHSLAVYDYAGQAYGFMKWGMPRLRTAIRMQLDAENAGIRVAVRPS
jgi:hypothetical protein